MAKKDQPSGSEATNEQHGVPKGGDDAASAHEEGEKGFGLHLDTAYEVTIDMTSFNSEPSTQRSDDSSEDDIASPVAKTRSILSKVVSAVKNIFSAALLGFCIVVLSAAIFEKQTTATAEYNLHPAVAFIVFWVLLLWLALMEGGLNCMVGLRPVEKSLYAHSHPQALGCTKLAHKGDNLDRFIVGRQYLDLTIVFTTSFMVSTIDNASVLGLPEGVNQVFLGGGLAVILITIVVGQLVAQINSAHCMLDFINNYVMLATTYAALIVEASGILHAVYLVQILVGKLAGRKSEALQNKTTFQKFTFWLRVAFSVACLLFALVVTFKALFDSATTMWSSVPAWVSTIILIVLIVIVGTMEGLQIAFMAVVHLSEDELKQHPSAYRSYKYICSDKRLQAFLVGRQIWQTVIMFVIARITTLEPEAENIFGVPDGLQQFFITGILGALFSTIVASLSWRVVASSFPVAFLSNPLSKPIIHFCLLIECTGICNVAWPMAKLQRVCFGFKEDDYYIGSVEERTRKGERTDGTDDDLRLTESNSSSREEEDMI